MMTLATSFLFLPILVDGNKGYLYAGSSPPVSWRGVGWGSGWLGPPLYSVLSNMRAGTGDKGQPLQMTNLSYVLIIKKKIILCPKLSDPKTLHP